MSDLVKYFFLAVDGLLHPDRSVYAVLTEGGNPEIVHGLQMLTLIGIFLCIGGVVRRSSAFGGFPKRVFWALIAYMFILVVIFGRPLLPVIVAMYWGVSVFIGKVIFAIGTFRMGVWGSRNIGLCVGIMALAVVAATLLNRADLGLLPSLALLGLTVYSTVGVLAQSLPTTRPVLAGLILILSVGGIFESTFLAYPESAQMNPITFALRYAGSFLLHNLFPVAFAGGFVAGLANTEIAHAVTRGPASERMNRGR
jgi:hypothetical protein